MQPFPTYLVTPIPLQNIHLRSGKVLKPRDSMVVIEEEIEGEETPEQSTNDDQPRKIVTPSILTQTPTTPHTEQPQAPKLPPYPERLAIENPIILPEFDLEAELRNVCVKIPLLQAIKDIPIYAKTIRDLCIKKPGRKRKDPLTIQVVGQLARANVWETIGEKIWRPREPHSHHFHQ
jgi:hypothetical protein